MPVEVKVEQRHKDEAVTLANRLNLTADQFTSGIADVFARSFAQFEARLSHTASTREGEEDVVRAAEDALDRYVADGFRMSDDERIGFKAGYRIAASLSPRPLPTREEVGHRFGSPPEPVSNPSAAWCEAYADWYYQGRG